MECWLHAYSHLADSHCPLCPLFNSGRCQYAGCNAQFHCRHGVGGATHPDWIAFFAAGLLAGLLLTLPTSIRRRFEIARLKRELAVAQQARDKDELPPPPPFI